MRLSELKTIQAVPKVKPLKPLTFTKIEIGVSSIALLRLQAEILYNLKIWLDEAIYPLSDKDRLRVKTHQKMILDIFKMDKDNTFISKREYKEMMRSMGIKSLR